MSEDAKTLRRKEGHSETNEQLCQSSLPSRSPYHDRDAPQHPSLVAINARLARAPVGEMSGIVMEVKRWFQLMYNTSSRAVPLEKINMSRENTLTDLLEYLAESLEVCLVEGRVLDTIPHHTRNVEIILRTESDVLNIIDIFL